MQLAAVGFLSKEHEDAHMAPAKDADWSVRHGTRDEALVCRGKPPIHRLAKLRLTTGWSDAEGSYHKAAPQLQQRAASTVTTKQFGN